MCNGVSIISIHNYFKSIAETKMGYRMAAISYSKTLHESGYSNIQGIFKFLLTDFVSYKYKFEDPYSC